MNLKKISFEIGDTCYLREDYEGNNISEEFNIQCEIMDLKYTQINHSSNNIHKPAGKVILVRRNDRENPEWVTLDSLSK